MIVVLLAQRLGLNSGNSSIPPSKDSNCKKDPSKPSDKKVSGQFGHEGVTLAPVDEADEVMVLYVKQESLLEVHYREAGFVHCQVVDTYITRVVTEYQAQILEDEQGKRFVVDFPDGVNSTVQYGNGVKAHAVDCQFKSLDTTSHSLTGEYANDEDEGCDEHVIRISHGHS
jgi:transposase